MRTVGLILGGGASRRMGADKGTLPWSLTASGTVLERVVDVIRPFVDTAVVLSGQESAYRVDDGLAAAGRIVVRRDEEAFRGPLAALHHAWPSSGEADGVCVVAGDLPGLTPRVLETCLDRWHAMGTARDGVVVVRQGKVQPLLGWYRPAAGRVWAAAMERGEARLMAAVELLDLERIDSSLQGWPEWWTRPIHTQEDYHTWLRFVGGAQDEA